MTMLYIGLGIVVFLVVAALVGKGKISDPPANLSDDAIRKVAQQGQKIQAIKWYRSLHGVGLKDAKEAVEKMTMQS